MLDSAQTYSETRFSWLFSGLTSGPDPSFDRDLSSHAQYAVVPSKGSLVPGWLLVIPRKEILSLSNLSQSERRELVETVQKYDERIKDFARSTFFFEHGPSKQRLPVGCGVDQAHLHAVLLNFDLISVC